MRESLAQTANFGHEKLYNVLFKEWFLHLICLIGQHSIVNIVHPALICLKVLERMKEKKIMMEREKKNRIREREKEEKENAERDRKVFRNLERKRERKRKKD